MKTVKKGKEIKRMPDGLAQEMVQRGWKYAPKSEWREKVRDAKPVETKKKVTKKNLKKKKDLKKLFGTVSNQCDAKYVENPKANAFRDKVLGKSTDEFGTHKLVHIKTRFQGKKDERK